MNTMKHIYSLNIILKQIFEMMILTPGKKLKDMKKQLSTNTKFHFNPFNNGCNPTNFKIFLAEPKAFIFFINILTLKRQKISLSELLEAEYKI